MNEITSLPGPLLVAIILFGIVQIAVEVYAIVDIIRRPADRIVGDKKIWWLLLVLFVNLIGAVIYLVAGRKPVQVDVARPLEPVADVARTAVDSLYGDGTQQ